MEPIKLTILIPAYNEAKRIAGTINALKRIEECSQIIVVNDGSQDNTAEIASKVGAQVVNLPFNQGKGKALNLGAQHIQGDFVALIDADLGNTASELKKLIEPVVSGEADITIAIFPPAHRKGGVGLVKKISTLGLRMITRTIFRAPLSGQRVMSRKVFESLLPLSTGFGVEVGMTVDAFYRGFKVKEVETNMGHAETGRDWAGFRHRGLQLKDVLFTLTLKGLRR